MGSEREGKPMSADEAATLAGRVADLAGAGLAMPDGLRCLAAEMPGRRLSLAALNLADRVERGESLAEAIEAQGRALPSHVRELLGASIRSGRMAQVLGEFVSYGRIGADLRRSLWIGLLYPLLMVLGFGALLALLYGYLVPQFRQIYDRIQRAGAGDHPGLLQFSTLFGGERPAPGAEAIRRPGDPLRAGGCCWTLRSRRWFVCRLPLAGAIFRWSALSEFCHFAAVMIDAELPLERAVVLAADATGDVLLADSGRQAARELAAGRSFPQALESAPAIPRGVAFFLGWAEGRQALPGALHTIGDLFAAEARGRAALVSTIVAVLLVVFVIWSVIFTVVGLFLPLVRLISALSG
ncbi:MAG: type II secretion system F family protein [Isosphaeraceae bacterium]